MSDQTLSHERRKSNQILTSGRFRIRGNFGGAMFVKIRISENRIPESNPNDQIPNEEANACPVRGLYSVICRSELIHGFGFRRASRGFCATGTARKPPIPNACKVKRTSLSSNKNSAIIPAPASNRNCGLLAELADAMDSKSISSRSIGSSPIEATVAKTSEFPGF